MKITLSAALWLLVALAGMPANAQGRDAELAELRELVTEMREDYERRISDLEARLARAEREASRAGRDAEEAFELAEETAINQSAGSSSPSAYNPAIGLVLMGQYADVGSGWEAIPGFMPAGEIGTGESGFGLGESELNLKSSIDARFYGNMTVALAEGEVEIEEAWLQTTALPAGLGVKAGRIFSSAGYLNRLHIHTDDFVDRPLPYQAFFGARYAVDGLQGRWIAPTSNLLVELGAELNWGDGSPATANAESSPGAHTLYAKVGGDVGLSNSWQAGIARISADVQGRGAGEFGTDGFSGDSDLAVFDFVWKWAPQGNATVHNFKLQGEYLYRSEDGVFDGIPYDGDQDGWYLQGAWQFRQLWRAGLRFDSVEADSGPLLAGTVLEDPGRRASRTSAMLDYSPSEFSRLRLQYTNDRVLAETDNQWYLQYIMSLGAHGAHQF